MNRDLFLETTLRSSVTAGQIAKHKPDVNQVGLATYTGVITSALLQNVDLILEIVETSARLDANKPRWVMGSVILCVTHLHAILIMEIEVSVPIRREIRVKAINFPTACVIKNACQRIVILTSMPVAVNLVIQI